MRTQVGIVGAGPAGLLLAQMLRNAGIDSVLFESHSEEYVIDRVRAGVLEQGTVDTLIEAGVGERLQRECMPHEGIMFRFGGQERYVDVRKLSGGKAVTVYGQQSVTRDLIAARRGYSEVLFETPVVALEDVTSDRPKIHYERDGERHVLECDFIAGCDGFWGVSRRTIPKAQRSIFQRVYPYSWLGILAEAPPPTHVVIYSHHTNGFALASMRSEQISRHYIQCDNDDHIDNWTDDEIWDELETRLANDLPFTLPRGRIMQSGITPMRSFVCETMRYGNLFLAGDAAHIVPPTGAKGMNLAVADVRVLAAGLIQRYRDNSSDWLDRYQEVCLDRIWKVERFSWWVTSMFHKTPGQTAFDDKMQIASLNYLTSSDIGGASFVENYVGLPYAV